MQGFVYKMDLEHGIMSFDHTNQHFIASTNLDIYQLQLAPFEEADESILPMRWEIFRLTIVQLLRSLLVGQGFLIAADECEGFAEIKRGHTGKLSAACAGPGSCKEI